MTTPTVATDVTLEVFAEFCVWRWLSAVQHDLHTSATRSVTVWKIISFDNPEVILLEAPLLQLVTFDPGYQ